MLRNLRLQASRRPRHAGGSVSGEMLAARRATLALSTPCGARSNSDRAADTNGRHGLSFGPMRKAPPTPAKPDQPPTPPSVQREGQQQQQREASPASSSRARDDRKIDFFQRRKPAQDPRYASRPASGPGENSQRGQQGEENSMRRGDCPPRGPRQQNEARHGQGQGQGQSQTRRDGATPRWENRGGAQAGPSNSSRANGIQQEGRPRQGGPNRRDPSSRPNRGGGRWEADDGPTQSQQSRSTRDGRPDRNGRSTPSMRGGENRQGMRRDDRPPPPPLPSSSDGAAAQKPSVPSAKNWRTGAEEKPSRFETGEEADRVEPVKTPARIRSSKEKEHDRRLEQIAQGPKEVFLPELISVNNLSRLIGIKLRTLQTTMEQSGLTDTRPAALLNFDDSSLLCAEYNLNAVSNEEAAFDIYPAVLPTAEEKATLPFRPPIITVMGHVDHGKTSLLDRLRSASVAAGEAGGITQHIGAFSVPVKGAQATNAAEGVNKITFLDTPGHAAFSNMRARGAKATDIVVLVVAADDGVMAQTKEVIELYHSLEAEARASAEADEGGADSADENIKRRKNIQLLVALSKCDRPAANTQRAKEQLAAAGIFVEDLGGETPSVEISSKTGEGFETLEETLAVMAELGDLRAPSVGQPEGIVLESRTEKGLGNTATVLVSRGKLTPGSFIIAGKKWAKVRGMVDSNGKNVKTAGPGEAVLVSGWKDLPDAGEEVLSAAKEDQVKKAVENRKAAETRKMMVKEAEAINEARRKKRQEDDRIAQAEYAEQQRRRRLRMVEALGDDATPEQRQALEVVDTKTEDAAAPEVEVREVQLILKSDFSGTGEALMGAVSGLVLSCPGHTARVKILSMGVGDLSDGDLSMARAAPGHSTALVGFNVKAPRSVQQTAKANNIDVFSSAIIYQIIDYVKGSLSRALPPKIETRVAGEATVAQVFSIAAGKGQTLKVAGVRVTNGVIARANTVRVLRPAANAPKGDDDDERKMDTIFEGSLTSIKQVKKEVNEMRKGTECGLSFDGFDDVREGDVVQCIEQTEVPIPFH